MSRLEIINMLEGYFELTQESGNANPEWDRGFQAAIALIRNDYNFAQSHENSDKMTKAYQIRYGIGTNARKGEQK